MVWPIAIASLSPKHQRASLKLLQSCTVCTIAPISAVRSPLTPSPLLCCRPVRADKLGSAFAGILLMVSLHLLEGSDEDGRGEERCQHITDLVETYGRMAGDGGKGSEEEDADDDEDDEDRNGETSWQMRRCCAMAVH